MPLQLVGGKGRDLSLLISPIPVGKRASIDVQNEHPGRIEAVGSVEYQAILNDCLALFWRCSVTIIGCNFGNVVATQRLNKLPVAIENGHSIARSETFGLFAVRQRVLDRNERPGAD
jgi:hypothetical protein